jgi:hypothetical protein
MRPPTDYFDLIERFVETTDALRALSDEDQKAAGAALMDRGLDLLLRVTDAPDKLEKLCVWHTDKLYRLLNEVEVLDGASFVFLRAVGAVFGVVTKQRGLSVAYLVDNEIPMDRLLGVDAAFRSLGFVVASPELSAVKLGAGPDANLSELRDESIALARRLFDEALAARRHVVWLSGAVTLAELQDLARALDGAPYVGIFRNDVPKDGTTVQVFRSGGASATSATLLALA